MRDDRCGSGAEPMTTPRCRDALRRCDLSRPGKHAAITTLSGGERERLALATLMVQDPAVWLLDEPLNHLDPQHQVSVMKELEPLRRPAGRIIVCTLHNPSLAARHASHALLLYGDGTWEFGERSANCSNRNAWNGCTEHRSTIMPRAGDSTGRTLLMPA